MCKSKVLLIVEGKKREPQIMNNLFDIYGFDRHCIVSYKSNIYSLYNKMFIHSTPEEFDILQILKESETDEKKLKLLDDKYTDIILIFDFDPQDTNFSVEKIRKMQNYFIESSDMGQMYINYPSVESYYYCRSIPDENYNFYKIDINDVKHIKQYVDQIRKSDFKSYAKDKLQCNDLIMSNIKKANYLCGKDIFDSNYKCSTRMSNILEKQIEIFEKSKSISILCTCLFYIYDFNPSLIIM